jgi:hypothetical protein
LQIIDIDDDKRHDPDEGGTGWCLHITRWHAGFVKTIKTSALERREAILRDNLATVHAELERRRKIGEQPSETRSIVRLLRSLSFVKAA